MLVIHTIEYSYHAYSSHYRIFLSYLQSVLSNIFIKLTMHTIEYSHHAYSSHYGNSHHDYNPHFIEYPIMLTIHTYRKIFGQVHSAHYRIFPSCLQFTLLNIPSCLQSTLSNISIMLAVHITEYSYQVYNPQYRMFHHACQSHHEMTLSYLQFALSNISIILAVHTIK